VFGDAAVVVAADGGQRGCELRAVQPGEAVDQRSAGPERGLEVGERLVDDRGLSGLAPTVLQVAGECDGAVVVTAQVACAGE